MGRKGISGVKIYQASKGAPGYGMALLLVFFASSILIATSTSLLLSPGISNYVGTIALDNSTAKQIAEKALDEAQANILTQQGAGTSITTAYRYPPGSDSNTISIPTYPGSGTNAVKGSYYVTAPYARGFTFLLKANVNVGSTNLVVYRLVQLSNIPNMYANSFAIYSLRRVNPSYAGSAVRVRCASTSTTTDIGFNATGDFDLNSFRTCLGDSTLPLDITTGEKLAYGLRKLSSSYSGYAVKVRRSSDNTTQDIGFDANGNLDIQALSSFVGPGNGYVTTWYDQSGSSKDLSQATTSKQPRIVNSGVLETKNNQPSVYFDGSDDSMSNTALAGTLITGSEIRAFIVSSTESGGSVWGRAVVLWKSGDSDAWNTSTSVELLMLPGSLTSYGAHLNGGAADETGISTEVLYQHTSYHDASNNLRLYRNGALTASSSASANLASTSIILGTSAGSDASAYVQGYISELLIFNSNVSTVNRQAIERNEGHFYNLTGMTDGYVTTWYDQSGHDYHITQPTAANQPTIDQAGSKLAVLFNKLNTTYMDVSGLNVTLSPATLTAFGVGRILVRGGGLDNDHHAGQMLNVYKTGTSSDRNADSEAILLQMDKTMGNMKDSDLLQTTANSVVFNTDMQVTAITDGATRVIRQYQTAAGLKTNDTSNKATQGVIINMLRVGASDNPADSNPLWDGRINEIVVKNSAMTATDYQRVESDERSYYGL